MFVSSLNTYLNHTIPVDVRVKISGSSFDFRFNRHLKCNIFCIIHDHSDKQKRWQLYHMCASIIQQRGTSFRFTSIDRIYRYNCRTVAYIRMRLVTGSNRYCSVIFVDVFACMGGGLDDKGFLYTFFIWIYSTINYLVYVHVFTFMWI